MNVKSSLESQISYKINSIKELKINKITLDVADSYNNNNSNILKKASELSNNQKKKNTSEQSKEETENDLHFQKIVRI